MQVVAAILFFGVPFLVLVVLPLAFMNALDRANPSDPDMW